MKTILSILLVCLLYTTNATDYYFSQLSGNDSRSATEAQNPNTPWQSTNKFNAIIGGLNPGDAVYFKRGETFYGSLILDQSGTPTQPITISAYGNGAKPIISGTLVLSNWVSLGNGVWESYNPALGSTVSNVLINEVPQEMGRYPNSDLENKGYLHFESHNTNTSITDNELSGSPNWTGAEIVIRKNPWILDRSTITSHSGKTISYTGSSYYAVDKFGYFIQNDVRTLDKFGEWYYNPSNKKLYVFFGPNPPSASEVKASAIDYLVSVHGMGDISLNNLSFYGANIHGLLINGAHSLTVANCDISYSGDCGIKAAFSDKLVVENCTIKYSNNNGIDLENDNHNAIIKGNLVENTSLFTGMGRNGDGSGTGINVRGNNNLVEYNEVLNTSYIGISFYLNGAVIKNNYVNNFSLNKSDGGGIYTYTGPANNTFTGRKIIGNIIVNGNGAGEGTDNPHYLIAEGIYLDDNSSGVEIRDNTVANVAHFGIFYNNARSIIAKNNTFFNNGSQLEMRHGSASEGALRNNFVSNNVFFSKEATQKVLSLKSLFNDVDSFATFDSNYYARPLDDKYVIHSTAYFNQSNEVNEAADLETWKAKNNRDLSSKKSPIQYSSYTIQQLTSANKLTQNDGQFSSTSYGAGCWTPSNNGVVSWDNNGTMDGGSVKISFTPTSGPSNTALITFHIGDISASKKYILRYSTKGSNDNGVSMGAYLRKTGEPYQDLTPRIFSKISSNRMENEVLFSPSYSETDATLMFIISDQDLKLWLDNVALYEADVLPTNPDDLIRFEFNPTQYLKTVSLDTSYLDVRHNTYSNSLTLQPYQSVVLMKQELITLPFKFLNFKGKALKEKNDLEWETFNESNVKHFEIERSADKSKFITVGIVASNHNTSGTLKYHYSDKGLESNTNYYRIKKVDLKGKHSYSQVIQLKNTGSVTLDVYPNPVHNTLSLSTTGMQKTNDLKILVSSVNGNLVKSFSTTSLKQNVSFDVSSLTNGIYFLKVISGESVFYKEFLKQ